MYTTKKASFYILFTKVSYCFQINALVSFQCVITQNVLETSKVKCYNFTNSFSIDDTLLLFILYSGATLF